MPLTRVQAPLSRSSAHCVKVLLPPPALPTPPCVLQILLDAKVQTWKEAISAISTEATQEMALEELLAKVRGWAGRAGGRGRERGSGQKTARVSVAGRLLETHSWKGSAPCALEGKRQVRARRTVCAPYFTATLPCTLASSPPPPASRGAIYPLSALEAPPLPPPPPFPRAGVQQVGGPGVQRHPVQGEQGRVHPGRHRGHPGGLGRRCCRPHTAGARRGPCLAAPAAQLPASSRFPPLTPNFHPLHSLSLPVLRSLSLVLV